MWTAPETDELVTTETWQPPESDAVVSATAEPPAAPEGDQLHQFEPPGLASRALEAARQYLSPILGRTELQRLNEGPRDAEGLLPAMSKPIVPLPKYEHQPGDGKLVGLGKAVGNTALGFAEFIESPLGIATGGVGSAVPAAMRATAGRVIAGGFAADLGSKLPEAIGTTRQTLNNPNAPFGQKAEAVLGTTAQGLIVAGTGYHAARGRAVNVEAANLEREVTAGAKTEWTPPARDVVLAEAATDAGLNEAPAAIASGGSPVERFIYEAKAKAQNEALDATQRAPAAVMVEPKPWEMDYGQGGEMPRETSKFTEVSESKTLNTKAQIPEEPNFGKGIGEDLRSQRAEEAARYDRIQELRKSRTYTKDAQLNWVEAKPAILEPTELAPNTESKNVPAAAMDANPVTEAKPAPPEQSSLTAPEVSTTGRGAAQAAPASSPGKSKKTSPTITGSNAQTGAEMPVPATKPGEAIQFDGTVHSKHSHALVSPDVAGQGWRLTVFNQFSETGEITPVGHKVYPSRESAMRAAERQNYKPAKPAPPKPVETPAAATKPGEAAKFAGGEFVDAITNVKTKWGGPTNASEIGAQTTRLTKALVDAGLTKAEAERVRNRATSYRVGHILRETTKEDFYRAMEEMGIVEYPKPVETPAAAVEKVQEHVAEVASGDKAVKLPPRMTAKGNAQPKTGPRPAKEIKSELVQRLEEEISKLPPAPEFLYTDPKRVQGKREFYVVAKEGGQRLRVREGGNSGGWTIETEKLSGKTGLIERKVIGSATGDVRAATRTAESAMERVLSGEQPKITIEIPGDGTFTIERTHAALNEVLRRASALDTRSGTPAKKSGPPGDPPTPDTKGIRTSARRIIEEASSILDGIESGKFPGEVKALDWVRSLGNTRPAWATVIEDRVRIGPRHNFTLREAARDYLKSGTDLYKHAEQWDIINKPVESGTLEGWADKVLSEDPRKRTRMGLDPVEESRRLAAVAIKGSYIIARGVRDFAQWSAEIIKQIPELAAKGEAELRRLYARAVDIAEGRDPEIGLSVRGMKIKADTSLSDQVRENTEAAYTKRVAANDIAEAQRLVTAAGGPEKAANDILTGLWKPVDQTIQVKGAGEVLAGLAKLEKAAAEADPVRANELADLQVRVAEFTTRNATTPAQWLQAYNSLYANYSPAAWLKEWRNGIDSARQTRVERATGKPVGESPVEIAQGIADGVADTVRADAPKTAEVIQAVYGSKNTKTQTPNTKAQPPETMPEAIERILGQKGEQAQRTARKIKDFYEREVEKFKRRHKIPELSPEDQRAILAEAKAIERLPLDSLQRREAVLRLLDQLHRRKGFEWWELPIGFWYAHTLSGPTTHAKNILGNSVNLGMEAGLQSLLKPTNIPIILESLGRSLSVGGKEAWSILKTGHDTSARHGDKFELRRNVMELQNGTMDKVLLPWKLVGRFLRAEDAVFFNAGQELRAAILAKRANGESTAAARKAMGWTPEARTAAEAQAASEGLTGLNYQRRVNEIIEQGRAGEVMNAAREFGYDVTFNNEPYGVLGAFTSAINRGFDAAPVLKPFILPFTRIVANVSNSSLNWTPVGSYRALRAQRKLAWLGRAENNGKLYGRAINDPLAIRDAHARALLGTAAIVGITAAAVKNVFDDNPQFMVTGSGPANLDQRKALRAAGWIPYSVKVGDKYISYADKPPQIALAMVGHYLDAIRYKNLDREDALNRVNYALNGSFGVLLQSSWLQGLSSLFNQANRESTKNVMQGITAQGIKTFSGVFVPAALRQLDQFFDPKRYSPDDVQGMVLAQIPWARRNGQPDLNAFGQPVSSPTSKIFYSKVEGDALVRRLAGQRVFPGVPAVGDLLPDEHYALVKYRGPILRELLAEHSDEWAGAPRLIAQDVVNRISSQATAQAKKDLGLDEANSDRREARKLKTR